MTWEVWYAISCIIRSYNKATGTTYVYESQSYRDPITKRPKSHRRCIGKIDPETNEIVPTGKRGRRKKESASVAERDEQAERGSDLHVELDEVNTVLQNEQVKNKELSDEVRKLRYQMKQIETAMESVAKAVDRVLGIFK